MNFIHHFIYTIVSIYMILGLSKIVVYLNNKLGKEREIIGNHIRGDFHFITSFLFKIIVGLKIVKKSFCIGIYFNELKESSTIDVIDKKMGSTGSKKEKIFNILIGLSVDLHPDYDAFLSQRKNGPVCYGPVSVGYYIKIFPEERIIKVILPSDEIAKISQKNISYSYIIPFSESTRSIGQTNIDYDKNKDILTIEDLLYDYTINRKIDNIKYHLGDIIEDYIQPRF